MRRIASADTAGFIQKPYTLHVLIDKVRSVLKPSQLSAGDSRPLNSPPDRQLRAHYCWTRGVE
jgi:hypothetical protein